MGIYISLRIAMLLLMNMMAFIQMKFVLNYIQIPRNFLKINVFEFHYTKSLNQYG